MENNKIISDEDDKKIRAMRLGDKNAILWGLKCTGLHYVRMQLWIYWELKNMQEILER